MDSRRVDKGKDRCRTKKLNSLTKIDKTKVGSYDKSIAFIFYDDDELVFNF